ncbi:hypothetical protein RFI_20344, partial [Reticulomyxa filosa]
MSSITDQENLSSDASSSKPRTEASCETFEVSIADEVGKRYLLRPTLTSIRSELSFQSLFDELFLSPRRENEQRRAIASLSCICSNDDFEKSHCKVPLELNICNTSSRHGFIAIRYMVVLEKSKSEPIASVGDRQVNALSYESSKNSEEKRKHDDGDETTIVAAATAQDKKRLYPHKALLTHENANPRMYLSEIKST